MVSCFRSKPEWRSANTSKYLNLNIFFTRPHPALHRISQKGTRGFVSFEHSSAINMGQVSSSTLSPTVPWKSLGVMYLALFVNMALCTPVSFAAASDSPLIPRGDINPVWEKFGTKADHDMPGYPEWSVLAKHNLSSWDDENWILSSTEPLQGMFPANRGLANGYVHLYFSASTPPLYL